MFEYGIKMNPCLRQRIKQEAIYVYRDIVMEILQQIDTAIDTVKDLS